MTNLTTRCVRTAKLTLIVISGELDLGSAALLDQELQNCGQPGVKLIADLTHVEFMDCVGLRVLLDASDRFGPERFAVTPGPPQVQRLFQLANAEGLHVLDCSNFPG